MKPSAHPIFTNALKFNLAIACLLLLCFTTMNTAVFAEDKPSLDEARFAVLALNVPHAVEIYSILAKTSGDANVLSETEERNEVKEWEECFALNSSLEIL